MKRIILAVGVTFFIISCNTSSKITANIDKQSVKLTEQQLATAAQLFNTRCGKCHNLPKPEDHTVEQWKAIMNRMAPMAKLTDEEKNWVLTYISSNEKQQN